MDTVRDHSESADAASAILRGKAAQSAQVA